MKIELNAREITALGKTIGGLLITAATVLTMLGIQPCSSAGRDGEPEHRPKPSARANATLP